MLCAACVGRSNGDIGVGSSTALANGKRSPSGFSLGTFLVHHVCDDWLAGSIGAKRAVSTRTDLFNDIEVQYLEYGIAHSTVVYIKMLSIMSLCVINVYIYKKYAQHYVEIVSGKHTGNLHTNAMARQTICYATWCISHNCVSIECYCGAPNWSVSIRYHARRY